jgi:hypothetical protein
MGGRFDLLTAFAPAELHDKVSCDLVRPPPTLKPGINLFTLSAGFAPPSGATAAGAQHRSFWTGRAQPAGREGWPALLGRSGRGPSHRFGGPRAGVPQRPALRRVQAAGVAGAAPPHLSGKLPCISPTFHLQVWRQLLSGTRLFSGTSQNRHFTFDRQEARDALALAGAVAEATQVDRAPGAAGAPAVSHGPSAEGGVADGGGERDERGGRCKSMPRPLLVQLYEQMAHSETGTDDATPLDVSSLHQYNGRAFHVSFNNEPGVDAGALPPPPPASCSQLFPTSSLDRPRCVSPPSPHRGLQHLLHLSHLRLSPQVGRTGRRSTYSAPSCTPPRCRCSSRRPTSRRRSRSTAASGPSTPPPRVTRSSASLSFSGR